MYTTNGFIKIHRQLVNWEWYTSANTMRVFFHCLLKANFKKSAWRGVVIPAGSFITSITTLSNELGLTEKQVRGALDRLKRTSEIATDGQAKYTVITVQNWKQYQTKGEEKASKSKTNSKTKGKLKGKQQADNGQTKGEQGATDKEEKESKKKKNIRSSNSAKILFNKIFEGEEDFKNYENLKESFETWLDYKNEIKDQYKGEIGIKNAFKKFINLSGGSSEKAEKIVANCAANNWKGLYEAKDYGKSAKATVQKQYNEGNGWKL